MSTAAIKAGTTVGRHHNTLDAPDTANGSDRRRGMLPTGPVGTVPLAAGAAFRP
jgi:hypothetical protein